MHSMDYNFVLNAIIYVHDFKSTKRLKCKIGIIAPRSGVNTNILFSMIGPFKPALCLGIFCFKFQLSLLLIKKEKLRKFWPEF